MGKTTATSTVASATAPTANRIMKKMRNTKWKKENQIKFERRSFRRSCKALGPMRVFVVFARLGAVRETTWLCARVWRRSRATIQVQCGSQARTCRVDLLIAYLSIATRDTCKAAQDMICVPRRYYRDLWRYRRQCDGGSKTHGNKNEKLLSMCDYVLYTCSSSCKNTLTVWITLRDSEGI